ncbi:dihydrolipoamide acetyltransferase family protein [Microbacterium album]|uniref:Dihydrolipoamide acetyltransferase component of pyruvate dehydrogenase complex n=1 Tax=Microbacterium album TaxID=2053191 RepID=A0A917IGL9_9MICO|nr:dihydrolipoamide acetyltransferase family protein [Microbacterium album]GGH43716.1 acetyltransferase component of pyruvate dehydrogenase complex [Microbacterium album]
MATVIRMPQLAAGGAEAAVQAWLVEPGDAIDVGQSIVEIETEKAVVEYEAEVAGVFAGSLVGAGEQAAVGAPIAVIAGQGEALDTALAEAGADAAPSPTEAAGVPEAAPVPAAPEPETAPEPESAPEPATVPEMPEAAPVGEAEAPPAAAGAARAGRTFVTPLVRRLAAERGIDVHAIPGTGPNGRITRRDFDAFVAAAPATPALAAPDAAPAATAAPGPAAPETGFTDVPHTGMRRAIARRLTESTSSVPHFFLVADTRVDELLALRERINASGAEKVSVNDLVLKAVAGALTDVPDANAIWTDEATRRFDAVDLAVAVSVPNGLLTPVVRGADRLSLGALSATVRELAGRAREGRLKQHELEGGSFSVSNLGMYGTSQFSAIINPPHAGILAVGAALKRPVVMAGGELGVATVMTVTLSADHRVLDGALAAEWLAAFVKRIENPLSILL